MRGHWSLARLAGRRPSGSPRIAVIGNCQGAAVTTALRLLLPEAHVVYHSVYRIARRFPAMADLVRELGSYDAVFAGSFSAPFRDGGSFEALRAAVGLVQMPVVVFSAYQPDIVYVGDLSDAVRLVRTPVGGYNSALALFGFLQGLSVEATLRLFDPEAYRLVGYLGIWEGSQATLLGLGRDSGWDLGPDLLRWTRRGPFMHLVNHPRMFVTNDLARGLLAKAGIAFPDIDLDSYAADEIVRLGSWPLYPGIAEQFGLDGSRTFLRPAEGAAMPRTIGLRAFVEGSFASYGKVARARLRSERVDQWLGLDGLVADLRRIAGA